MRIIFGLLMLPLLCLAQDKRQEIDHLIETGNRQEAEDRANGWVAEAQSDREKSQALNALALAAATGRADATARVRELTGRAIALENTTVDGDVVDSLLILGGQLTDAGDYTGAAATLQQALSVAAEKHGAESFEAARVSLRLSLVIWLKGDYAKSRALDQHALDIFEKQFGPEDPRVAEGLASLAADVYATGQYVEARALFERAAGIQKAKLGANSAAYAKTLTRLANDVFRIGDYAFARSMAEHAVSILESLGGDRLKATADAQKTLGMILAELGDYSGARHAQDRALEIFDKQLDPDSVLIGDNLVTMGLTAKDSGDLTRAKRLFLRAVTIYEKKLGPENTRVGGALDNLGQTFVRMKDFENARAAFEKAIAIQKKALGPDHMWVANLYQGLAKVEASTGHYSEAQKLLEQNLAIWREELGPAHPFTAASLTQLAGVLTHLGQQKAALDIALEAAHIRFDEVASTVRTVDERQALRFAERNTAALDTALSIADAKNTSDVVAVWNAVIHSRGRVLDEMAARHRAAREANTPELNRLFAEMTEARSGLASMVVQGKGSASADAWLKEMAARRDAVHGAEEALATKSARYRAHVERERAGFLEISHALPSGAALVAWVRYEHSDYSSPEDRQTGSYVAFVFRHGDTAPAMIRLGTAARIESQVAAWRHEIDRERDAAGHSERINEASYRVAATALRHSVWDPLAPALAGVGNIYLVPDGVLLFVNFAALPADGAANRYLVETGPLLHILSAERDLAARAAPGKSREMLAAGNPAYQAVMSGSLISSAVFRGGRSSCDSFAPVNFDPLPASALEVRELAAIWRSVGGKTELLTGADATEAAIKELAAGKRVIHIASHGFFLDDACTTSTVIKENPLLRAGLALAGANHRGAVAAGGEDGILTAEEASSLDLRDAEWVVLSGCDTGLGDLSVGEGVLGLRRAFQEAGARVVIASLWPVQDQATRPWMSALYRARFAGNHGTAEAMQIAYRSVIAARRKTGASTHPFYWASFVATGGE